MDTVKLHDVDDNMMKNNGTVYEQQYAPQKTSLDKAIKSQHAKTVTILTSWINIQHGSCMEKEKPILELNMVVHVPPHSEDSIINHYHIF